jgi:glycosyltransferase involved in cell wall biosynthesis
MRSMCVEGLFLHRRYFGSGVHVYAISLLRQMERLTAGEQELIIRVLIPELDQIDAAPRSRQGFELVPSPAMRRKKLWRLGLFMLAARRLKPDVLFLPFPFPIYVKPMRLAVTVHDVIPLLFPLPSRSPSAWAFRQAYSSSLRRADLILADSEYSKGDIVSVCGISPERIVVAHLAFDRDAFMPAPVGSSQPESVLVRYGIRQPYVLHVGKMEPRKNLVRLVQAYRLLLERRKDFSLQLVLCGGQLWGCEELNRLVRQAALQGKVILTGVVPPHELPVLHRRAACFAMPSLYEGFGVPPLEAMASGVPVMCSNRSSLPEIAGDAALYFDPESLEEMSAAMERILADSALREQLVERGLMRARQFSWDKCAAKTLFALKALCAN